MSDVTGYLLTGLLNHGQLLLGLTLYFAALGLPLPATLLVLASGAFVRQGFLQAETAALVALLAASAGDLSSYLMGRYAAGWLPARWRRSPAWAAAERHFSRWGAWTIVLSRFLLTPIAWPVNLLAGSTRYAWHRFLLAVVGGEAIWVLGFGGLGLVFADQWEAIGDLAGNVAGLLLGLLMLLAGAYRLLRQRSGADRPAGAASAQAGRNPSTDR